MNTYAIQYIDGHGVEDVAYIDAVDKTKAYLSFVYAHPIDHTITNIKEKMKMFNLRSENGKFIVRHNGKEFVFHTIIGAYRFVKYVGAANA